MKNVIILVIGFVALAVGGKFYVDYAVKKEVAHEIATYNKDGNSQKANAPKTKQAAAKSFNTNQMLKNYPAEGKMDSSVVLYEFMDYQCGYCKKFVKSVDAHKDKIKVVYIDLPVLGKVSEIAAQVAMASVIQGKYLEMHHGLMNHKGKLSEKAIFDIAKKNGLDVNKLKTDMKSEAVINQIKYNFNLARSVGATGTPYSVIVNGTDAGIIPGYATAEELDKIIKHMGK